MAWKRCLTVEELPEDLRKLLDMVKAIRENKELDSWLWKHTRSENHYNAIISALLDLEKYLKELVEW